LFAAKPAEAPVAKDNAGHAQTVPKQDKIARN
jgi:hypothetical protein